MNMESRQNASSTINIYLHFPMCFHKYNYRPYLLSYNDAMQSEFVKTLLENEPPEEECPMMKNVNYTIPFSLYKNVRGVDLHYFMKCWMGEESITAFRIDNSSHLCYKSIAKMCQSLLLSEEMLFVKLLNERYPPCPRIEL